MTTIGVIYKKEDRLIAGTAAQVRKELKKQGYKIGLAGAKFCLTLGGDGTILRAARILAKSKIPILGIHMGGLGFLTEIDLTGLGEALVQIKQKKFTIETRTMIEAQAGGKKLIALNDLVICKSGIARVIKLELEGIAEYTSDGIIFATASGSTAYNLSAGGPILTPDDDDLVITAICPHTISNRSLVVHQTITARLNRGSDVILTADGQQMIPLYVGQKIQIQKSQLTTRFIRLQRYDFFGRIKDAFGFGPEC